MNKKRMTWRCWALALCVCSFGLRFSPCEAQPRGYNNYFGIGVVGGPNSLVYTPEHGNGSSRLGFGGGLHYAHFVDSEYGFGIGVGYSFAQSTAVYDFTETTEGLIHPDNPGVTYDLSTSFDNWKEYQTVGFLNIPVKFLWRSPLSRKCILIGGVGAQLDLPLHSHYAANEGAYRTTGYFPATGHSVSDQPQHGFGSYKADMEGEIEGLKGSVSLLADLGIRLAMNNNWGIYLGGYVNFGLTSCIDGKNKAPLLTIDARDASQIVYNGTFSSNEVDGVRLFCAGIKVGLDVGWNRWKKRGGVHRYPWSRVRMECSR